MEHAPRRLYRSTKNRVIAGVCGGLGEYFNVDPTIIRVGFIVLFLGGGIGLLAYLVLWLVIPEHGGAAVLSGAAITPANNSTEPAPLPPESRRWVFGVLLLLIGLVAYGNMFLPWRIFHWNYVWPLLLVVLGVVIIMKPK